MLISKHLEKRYAMKVLLINSVVDFGSTGKITRDLADELEKNGHQVLIAFGRNVAKDEKSTFNFSNKIELAWHLIMTRLFGRHGLHSSLATKKLIKEIKSFQPDIVHLHNLHGYYLDVPKLMKYLKTIDVKIVWTMHDMWCISGSVAYYAYNGCQEWDDGCVICNQPNEYPKSLLFKRQKRNFAWKKEMFTGFNDLTVVTVSKWLKSEFDRTFFKQYPIIPIYNGLTFKDYEEVIVKDDISDEKIKLLGVANKWETRKGLDDFVKLSEILDENYEITLVGLSKEQVKKLPENIVGIERTSNFEELIKLYKKSDLYVNLSVEETMGMTTVEALALGTPVVVYDQTAVPEIINKSVGKVTPAGDINKLKEAIDETVKRKICAQLCIDFAKEHYSKEEMMKKYFEVYNI